MRSAPDTLRLAAALAATALVGGCMADPMPSPGRPDPSKIVLSTTRAQPGGPVSLVGVVGVRGAVPESGFVEIRPLRDSNVLVFRSSADGTFAAILPGAVGDELELTFRLTADGDASEPLRVTVADYALDAAPPTLESDPGAGVNVTSEGRATAPDADGFVPVTGFGLVEGDVVFVGNVRSGDVVETTAGPTGEFATRIAARVGDTLLVIVRNAGGLTSQSSTLSVPAP